MLLDVLLLVPEHRNVFGLVLTDGYCCGFGAEQETFTPSD